MTSDRLHSHEILPDDASAWLVGRVWSTAMNGPCVVLCEDGELRDLTALAPTLSALFEALPTRAEMRGQPSLGALDDYISDGGGTGPAGHLLAPCDLQAVKAAGVTFANSMLERVIEERAKGDPAAARAIREALEPIVGKSLKGLVPGSARAMEVKSALQEQGLWSQYLEVGIGEYAEIFTKSQPMSAVGCGAGIGISTHSDWNNPEPEIVLAVNSRGEIVGASLGNDVNLRDIEGRSALLLGKAKDNNGSCAIGPFVRLFDDRFTLATIETAQVALEVSGTDGFSMTGVSDMAEISRTPRDLVSQTINANHHYPDGFVLFLGTLFAPVADRDQPGGGFTHKSGDRVKISSPLLGALINTVDRCDRLPEWNFGIRALMENLAARGLL